MQLRLHLVGRGKCGQLFAQRRQIRLRRGEINAHEKQARIGVAELRDFFHVAVEASTKPETACTSPLQSGQERVRI